MAIKTHIGRVFDWKLAEVDPLPAEAKRLADASIANAALQAYLAWRHSMLLVALPFLLLTSIFEWIGIATYATESDPDDIFKDGTVVVNIIARLGSTVLCIAVILALRQWSQWHSTRILKIGWAIGFALPFLPALVPFEFFLTSDFNDELNSSAENKAILFTAKITLAIIYGFQLFPVLVTLPSGITRASLRIRGLLPEALLSSWILIIIAPFQSVVFLMAVILLIQVAGNWILVTGTLCLMCAPWIYVFRRRLYVCAPTDETEKQLGKTQRIIGLISRLGFILLLVWALVTSVVLPGANEDGTTVNKDGTPVVQEIKVVGLVSYTSLLTLIFSVIGRNLSTTVVFSDALLSMTVTNWREDKARRANGNGNIDTFFGSIESSIRRAKGSDEEEEDSKHIDDLRDEEKEAQEHVEFSFVDVDV
jgi:hypothetical protein